MNWDPQVRKLEVGYAMARSHQAGFDAREAVRAEMDDAFTLGPASAGSPDIDARATRLPAR